MKLKSYFYLACLAIIPACSSNNTGRRDLQPDEAFKQFSERFINELWKQEPEAATMAGYHNYDSILPVPDQLYTENIVRFCNGWLDSLKRFDKEKLSAPFRIDYNIIQNELEKKKWQITEAKREEWDPSQYNISDLFAFMLNEHYAPLRSRVDNFYKRLLAVPAYYEAAKANIKNPVPELTSLAIDQNLGGLSIFESDFADSLKKLPLAPGEQEKMIAAANNAASAIKNYAAWLKNLAPDKPRSFRLGAELYEQQFRYDIQSRFTAAEIFAMANDRKKFLHEEMARLGRQLWPKYFGNRPLPADSLQMIGKLIDTLSIDHVKPEEFQLAIEKQLPVLINFIKEKNLIYIDPAKPLVVRKEPAYMAGVAGASINAPGPYDKSGNTYYNVGSLEGWPAAKAESYLREYNNYILQILNIHEAIPGHYTQLVYSNQSPSLVKSLFGNGAMVEGWAVYTEQMMLENGYGDNTPEMWLMWYKWHLRTVCNTILDYSVHTQNMQKDAAIRLLTQEAFQQQAEAEGKWKRVSVTSVQLTSYYTGYKEIYDLREAYRKKLGDQFNLKQFQEQFLSYGSAPVKYIRQMMIADN